MEKRESSTMRRLSESLDMLDKLNKQIVDQIIKNNLILMQAMITHMTMLNILTASVVERSRSIKMVGTQSIPWPTPDWKNYDG